MPKNLKLHFFFWAVFIVYEIAMSASFRGEFANVFDYAGHFTLNISLFYFHAHITLESSMKRSKLQRYFRIILFIVLEFLFYLILKYGMYQVFQLVQIPLFLTYDALTPFVLDSLWRAVYFIMLSSGYWFALSVIKHQKTIAEMENRELRNQLEKQVLENACLQSQINPHFLFNTLNFLYISINRVSEKVSESVLLLAAVMRYSLEGPGKDGKSALTDELEQIQNFIELNQARFDNQLHIDFRVEGDASELRFIPLALLTFIENVFKYADLRDPANPAIIHLAIQEDEIKLSINNKIRSGGVGHSHGIGMDNVKKRLDIYYKDQYLLKVDATEHHYQLSLLVNC